MCESKMHQLLSGQDPGGVAVPPAVRLVNVAQTHGGRAGVKIDALTIRRGSVTAILGGSGTGKSTLLHLIGGMARAESEGPQSTLEANIRGKDGKLVCVDILRNGWARNAEAIGFVFQHPFLLRHSSGLRNLAMPFAATGHVADFDEIERFWTTQLRMPRDKADLPAHVLSGGMQQRLAVGRALICNPQILLADEPTANLDQKLGDALIEDIVSWRRDGGDDRTVIIVTHDVRKAAAYADEVIVLDPHVVVKGIQIRPGCLLGRAALWPRSTPRDNGQQILAWMEGETPSAPGIEPAPPPRLSSAPEVHQESATDGSSQASVKAAARHHASAMATWTALGFDVAFSEKPFPTNKRGRIVVALLFNGFLAAAAYYWVFGTGLIPLFASVYALAVVPLAVAPLLPRLSASTFLRIVLLTTLTTIAVAAVQARAVIKDFTEAQLNSPDLQPLIVSAGQEALTQGTIGTVKDVLFGTNVPAQRRLFGRAAQIHVPIFVPQNATAGAVPDCSSAAAPKEPLRATVLGVEPDEQFLSNLDWAPVVSGDQNTTTTGPWGHGTQQRPAQPLTDGDQPRIYMLEDFARSTLQIGPKQPTPLWVCMSDFQGYTYKPYRVTTILRYIPHINTVQFDIVTSCNTAATLRGVSSLAQDGDQEPRVPVCDDDDFIFDYLAIKLSPEPARDNELKQIKLLSDRRVILAETGFQKVQDASTAAPPPAGIASWFIIVTAAVTCMITLFFVVQFIVENRQPLAVARAFGARFRDVALLVGISLIVPLGTALLLGLFFTLTAVRQASQFVALFFGAGSAPASSDLAAFGQVALCGVVMVAFVFFTVLGVWWWRSTRSYAAQLQEVG